MLSLPGRWVWDFWLADDGEVFHLFFLHASESLGEKWRCHRAARIGHATSTDLRSWQLTEQPFDVGPVGSFDETATWTGNVVRGGDGRWRMFYTGSRFVAAEPDVRNVETVGVAMSDDLQHWTKQPGPIVRADPRWYETFGTSSWREEAWRDPWVFPSPDGVGWHMLVTARADHGPIDDRGVIGHAYSADLATWEVLPPLSDPGAGFAHLEVPQVAQVDGQWLLLFSCPPEAMTPRHAARHPRAGTWVLPVADPTQPFDVTAAVPLTTTDLYSGRLVADRDGSWALMAFLKDEDGPAVPGGITDPLPIRLGAGGVPTLTGDPTPATRT